MLDAICSTKTYQQINGEAVPTQVVKSRLLKVGYEHIQYVFFSLDRSTSKVKNIRQYMLTVLYNAPAISFMMLKFDMTCSGARIFRMGKNFVPSGHEV